MTIPWESPADTGANGVPWTAEQMQPDTYTPAVATNTATGVQVAIDIGPQLRAAVQKAVDEAVAGHPLLGPVVRHHRERDDLTLMQSSILDVTVATVAALVTFVSPESDASGMLWLAAAVLASRTLIQAAIQRLLPEAT